MTAPSESSSSGNRSSDRPPPGARGGISGEQRNGRGLFQRIGWRRPTAGERRLWLIQGLVVVAAVLLVGALMFWALS